MYSRPEFINSHNKRANNVRPNFLSASQRYRIAVSIVEYDIVYVQIRLVLAAPAHYQEICVLHGVVPALSSVSKQELELLMLRAGVFKHILTALKIRESVPLAVAFAVQLCGNSSAIRR